MRQHDAGKPRLVVRAVHPLSPQWMGTLPNQFHLHGQFTRLGRRRRMAFDKMNDGQGQDSVVGRSIPGRDDVIASCRPRFRPGIKRARVRSLLRQSDHIAREKRQ